MAFNRYDCSRRDVLKGGLALSAGLALASLGGVAFQTERYLQEQLDVWERTFESNDEFLRVNAEVLSNVVLGFSYAPEEFDWICSLKEFKPYVKDWMTSDIALTNVLTDFNLKYGRFGTRWNRVDTKEGFDFWPYKSTMEIAFFHKANICWNFGDIKTFRHPEEFIPVEKFRDEELPGLGTIITLDSPISRYSLEHYLPSLFEFMQREYGHDLTKISILQPNNELFNPFGPGRLTIGFDHQTEVIKIADEFLPGRQILLSVSGGPNSADRQNPDIRKAQRFIEAQQRGGFRVGFNYYHDAPGFPRSIITGEAVDNYKQLKIQNGHSIFSDTIEWAKKHVVTLEITEGQMEPWGNIVVPGNSLRELQFMILRASQALDPRAEYQNIVRLWGIERLALRKMIGREMFTEEHEKMAELIFALSESRD